MKEIVNLSRRDFLKTGAIFGGGLVLGFCLPLEKNSGTVFADPPSGPFTLNAFVRIGTDNVVTMTVNKSEMGQGVYTSLPMLLAEELECDWRMVRVEAAPVAPVYNHPGFGIQMTGGSTSVASEWERMRQVGAAAREMLLAAAADTWQTDKKTCRVDNGVVIHTSGKKLTYGQLAVKAATMKVPEKVPLKDPSSFRIVGKPILRLDTPDKVKGKALFGIDAKIPGALVAVVARPPVFGGKVKSVQSGKTKAYPGVRDVAEIGSGVAVIADTFWAAKKGRDVLEVTWDGGPLAALSTEKLREQYAGMAATPGAVATKKGDAQGVLSAAAKRIVAEYEVPYLAHATMEPLNCLVDLGPEKCEIWTGTQFQTVDRNNAAKAAGLKPEQVTIHTTFLGGGFGRRGNPHSDFIIEAVEVAKAAKKPVKVVWSREDDMKGGYYRPMWYDKIAAGLDEKGNLVAWRHTIVGQSIMVGTPFEKVMIQNGVDRTSVEGADNIPYDIPNILVDLHSPLTGVPVLWWRSVGNSHTGFVIDSFMDEAAHAAGKDPFEFRRDLLAKSPRHRRVLELAAQKAGWGTPLPAGRARGIALAKSFGSYVSEVAEVSLSPEGEVRVHKVVCAVDCGRVVNPSIVEAQMEGGIVYGLSAALYGAITFKNGSVEQSNFGDYPVLRMDEMPLVEVHIVPSKEAPSGVGEPGTPPIPSAVTNAIFALTGKRIRRLPIDTAQLKRTS
jgi:isoquinoline 1-oxidoreductase subunit beta